MLGFSSLVCSIVGPSDSEDNGLESLLKEVESLVKIVNLVKESNPEQWNEAVRRVREEEAKEETTRTNKE